MFILNGVYIKKPFLLSMGCTRSLWQMLSKKAKLSQWFTQAPIGQEGNCKIAITCRKQFQNQISKPGGLNSRDQLRSRFLDLSRRAFKTCQDFLDCQDKLFFSLSRFKKKKNFQSQLWRVKIFVEIVETHQDLLRHRSFVWVTSGPKILTN